MKTLIPFLLAIVLTACGGGGGGGGGSPSSPTATISLGTVNLTSSFSYIPSIAEGSFTNDGAKYVVIAGWHAGDGSNRAPSPEVKVFKISADTTVTDATTAILGGAVTASVNYPLVADFNGDGIDDIALMGFTDSPAMTINPNVVYLSRVGHSHLRVDLVDPGTWSHGATVTDVNNDGTLDILNSNGHIWLNDGVGNFTYQAPYAGPTPNNLRFAGNNYGWGGSGICAGDFNNTGHTQVVITDIYTNGDGAPILDNVIFELDANLEPLDMHVLPMPYYDRTNATTPELSHDVSCVVSDLNNDGKLDIVVISANNSLAVRQGLAPHANIMQVYLNQGNFNFVDATSSGYELPTLSSYIPKVIDYNNDGNKDIWLASWDNQSLEPNLLWMNNGTSFTQSNVPTQVRNKFSSQVNNNLGVMYPVKLNNEWLFVTTAQVNDKVKVGVIKP